MKNKLTLSQSLKQKSVLMLALGLLAIVGLSQAKTYAQDSDDESISEEISDESSVSEESISEDDE